MKTFFTIVFSVILAITLGLFSMTQYLELREVKAQVAALQEDNSELTEKLSVAREELIKASTVLNKNAVTLMACAEDLDDPYYAAKHWTKDRYVDVVELTHNTANSVGSGLRNSKDWLVTKTGIGDGK